MNRTIIGLAVIEAAMTFCLAALARTRLGPERRVAAALGAGLALPLLMAAAAIIFFAFQPAEKAAWSGLAFAAMLGLALYALPVCLGTSLLALYLPGRTADASVRR